MKPQLRLILFACPLVAICPAFAHEYWLAPLNYKPIVSEPIKVDIRNGEGFSGRAYTCIPEKIKSIRLVNNNQIKQITCKNGDFPAVKTSTRLEPGLYSLLVETTERRVSYGDWNRFSNFIKSHGQYERLSQYDRPIISERRIKEQFYRFAKTLLQVGESNLSAWDQSKPLMNFEIVPLSNPMGSKAELDVKLFYQDKSLPNQYLDVFLKRNSVIEKTSYKTNENGIATINISPIGEYLINSVLLLEPDQTQFDWKTLWTSLTFIR